ncbi:hypothetical protein GGX14DRAFT_481763 [Mycena pura]|uniref:HypA-like protein n=1 Tax=Mycena pura TaxID=153505 RepID=A0AAD6UVE6_9AGAR|nr:hypothetical protein GGX14DRAFT_481763 [Mycena pura]
MDSLPVKPLKPGLVNLPGATPASAALVAELIHKDFVAHHCFFNDKHFHNHLSHHVLSLHDLGAPPERIQTAFDEEAAMQRPLHHGKRGADAKADGITQANWTSHMGETNAHMYADYLAFFSSEIAKHGVPRVLERYVFSPEANGNGAIMLARFFGGLLHPFIQAGFGIEFGQDFMVAEGLAAAALTTPEGASVMDLPSGVPEIRSGAPSSTLLALLHELYSSTRLQPMPYEETEISLARVQKWIASDPGRGAAIRDIYAKWTFDLRDDADISGKVDECMWQAALLLGAIGKAGRKPRMDFLLMHFLTGSLFLRTIVETLAQPLHKAQLLQAYAHSAALFVLLRGRPHIDCALAMSYPVHPMPPTKDLVRAASLGGSAWLPLLNNAAVHPEAHVIKSMRTLFYCAQRYGSTPAGAVIGAVDSAGKETHKGALGLDGTVFVRIAGVLTDALGWVAHGEKAHFWDFRGGWEEAWSKQDE